MHTPAHIIEVNAAAETARLARVAATNAAREFGRVLADQHLTTDDLFRVADIGPSMAALNYPLDGSAPPAEFGPAAFGLDAYTDTITQLWSVPMFANAGVGVEQVGAFLAGVREVRDATRNGYRRAR